MRLENQQPKSIPLLTQDQRLKWIKELLTGDGESLHYRVAGILVLLYAQPLVKVAVLPTTAIVAASGDTRISLGAEPVPVPEPFGSMLEHHLHHRPNLGTASRMAANPWLFPSRHPGKHRHTRSIVNRLSAVGINVLGARDSALRNLVAEMPPPVVAQLLGFSDSATTILPGDGKATGMQANSHCDATQAGRRLIDPHN